jgi:2-oxoglutarate ferredoxin oxidoreductase subunit delta
LSKAIEKKANLQIKRDLCKGCKICVQFCPKDVLTMEGGKVKIKDIEKCIECGLCELRCPDYAIFLGGSEDEE